MRKLDEKQFIKGRRRTIYVDARNRKYIKTIKDGFVLLSTLNKSHQQGSSKHRGGVADVNKSKHRYPYRINIYVYSLNEHKNPQAEQYLLNNIPINRKVMDKLISDRNIDVIDVYKNVDNSNNDYLLLYRLIEEYSSDNINIILNTNGPIKSYISVDIFMDDLEHQRSITNTNETQNSKDNIHNILGLLNPERQGNNSSLISDEIIQMFQSNLQPELVFPLTLNSINYHIHYLISDKFEINLIKGPWYNLHSEWRLNYDIFHQNNEKVGKQIETFKQLIPTFPIPGYYKKKVLKKNGDSVMRTVYNRGKLEEAILYSFNNSTINKINIEYFKKDERLVKFVFPAEEDLTLRNKMTHIFFYNKYDYENAVKGIYFNADVDFCKKNNINLTISGGGGLGHSSARPLGKESYKIPYGSTFNIDDCKTSQFWITHLYNNVKSTKQENTKEAEYVNDDKIFLRIEHSSFNYNNEIYYFT